MSERIINNTPEYQEPNFNYVEYSDGGSSIDVDTKGDTIIIDGRGEADHGFDSPFKDPIGILRFSAIRDDDTKVDVFLHNDIGVVVRTFPDAPQAVEFYNLNTTTVDDIHGKEYTIGQDIVHLPLYSRSGMTLTKISREGRSTSSASSNALPAKSPFNQVRRAIENYRSK